MKKCIIYLINIFVPSTERRNASQDGQCPHDHQHHPDDVHPDVAGHVPGDAVDDPQPLKGQHHDAPDGQQSRHHGRVSINLK